MLFLKNRYLGKRISSVFLHHYYDIVSRLSVDGAVSLATALELPVGLFFLDIAFNSYKTTDQITDAFIDFLQLAPLSVFHTMKFTPVKKKGYLLYHDRSFSDIFEMNRTNAERLVGVNAQKDDLDSDHCYADLNFLRKFAGIRKIQLVFWIRDEKRRLRHFEENILTNRSLEQKCIDLIIEEDHHFRQVTFEGYTGVGPTADDLPIPELTMAHKKWLECHEVWVSDLLQRSGYVCKGSDGVEVRFDIKIKLQSQDKKAWTTTNHASFGCRRASLKMLEMISPMIEEYRKQTDMKGKIFKNKIMIPYKDHVYGVSSLTPSSDRTVIGDTWGPHSSIQYLKDHYQKIHDVIKPAVIDALSPWSSFVEFLWNSKPGNKRLVIPGDKHQCLQRDLKELYRQEEEQDPNIEQYWDNFRQYADDPKIVEQYIHFLDGTLRNDGIHEGYPHPCVLRAMAILTSTQLEFYLLTEEGEMVPHPKYQNIIPTESIFSYKFLYFDDYRFEALLSFGPRNNNNEISYRWSCDNAMVSRCGKFKLSEQTLVSLMNAGKLDVIAMQHDEVSEEKVEKLTVRVNEHDSVLLKHEGRITVLEDRGNRSDMGNIQDAGKIVALENKVAEQEEEIGRLNSDLKTTKNELASTNKNVEILTRELSISREKSETACQQVRALEARLNEFIPQRNAQNRPIENNNNNEVHDDVPNNPVRIGHEPDMK